MWLAEVLATARRGRRHGWRPAPDHASQQEAPPGPLPGRLGTSRTACRRAKVEARRGSRTGWTCRAEVEWCAYWHVYVVLSLAPCRASYVALGEDR